MTCPPEISNILLNLLTLGILRIRAHAHDPDRCFIEADHIHNLPDLIRNYSPSALAYYWNVERTSFIEQSSQADRATFEEIWNELRPHAECHETANVH